MKSRENGFYTTITRVSGVAIAAMTMLAAGSANAQLPMPTSTQFDITGQIQEATLDAACRTDAHCGGTITIQGHRITIPKETIVLYPANATTWQELFALAPAPYGLAGLQAGGSAGSSGLALNDLPAPINNYEGHVVGNRVLGGPGGADLYIAGLVYVTSNGLNTGAGFINFIDYTLGEIRVGGTINDPNCAQGGTSASNPLCSGARVRINDPTGRFGRTSTSPDVRFGVDPENPTIMAGTGFPMCLPRVNPNNAGGEDALCPQAQRPAHLGADGVTLQFDATINTNDPRLPGLAGVPPDANLQVPIEVGDFIFFSGVVVKDGASPTAGPWPTNGLATYTAAWAITSNVAVYTAPGSDPAYIMVDVAILGTGGLSVLGAGESVVRTRFEGMTTDAGRSVHLYAVDYSPLTGTTSDRDYGTIGVDPGAPNGAVKGRWRFRPPCDPFGSVPAKAEKACVMNAVNTFLPPPREVRAVLEGAWLPNAPAGVVAPTAANGITWGQYRNPAIEYLFPENVPGTPVVANNFNTIGFLADGGYPSSTGVIPGQLNPWPDAFLPTPSCVAPTANANGPYTVAAGGTTALTGTATGTGPFTFAWTASSGSVAPANTANATFSAVGATAPVTVTLTVTGRCGTGSNSATIAVNAARAPTMSNTPALSVFSGANGSFQVSATDPNTPAQRIAAFTVTQTGAPALLNLAVGPIVNNAATVTFRAPVLPAGQVTTSVITLSTTARNQGGTTSAPDVTTVTIKPIPDQITITGATYRTGKQRLDLTVTSSVVSPNLVLTLQPFLTASGTTFDPRFLGNVLTNTGGGAYTMTLVGAPEPAIPPGTPLVVTSSLGGTSPASGLTLIRP